MAKRISKLTNSLKQVGEIQVTEWDFMALLNKDIRDLEFANSLRQLGRVRVMDLDFKTSMPSVNRIANQEIDIVSWIKRTAQYKVMEWDFNPASDSVRKTPAQKSVEPSGKFSSPDEMQAVALRLKNFLQYVAVNLIDEPKHAEIKVTAIGSNGLHFKMVLVKRDVAMLIGMEGHTAEAIRSILKNIAELDGVQVFLQIHSHEQEAAHLLGRI
ncbi:MAG: KH domain-containing protein [Gloeobacteraceae cyanobacterium ES-bin-144]|nr:KH domain-containing protein [Verrucomicrobiales bacterium]